MHVLERPAAARPAVLCKREGFRREAQARRRERHRFLGTALVEHQAGALRIPPRFLQRRLGIGVVALVHALRRSPGAHHSLQQDELLLRLADHRGIRAGRAVDRLRDGQLGDKQWQQDRQHVAC